jgi:hypothetical protein
MIAPVLIAVARSCAHPRQDGNPAQMHLLGRSRDWVRYLQPLTDALHGVA